LTTLKTKAPKATIDILEIDVTNDESIYGAAKVVKEKYRRLDGKLSS
jgi:hypothetical protein